jgi:hypothetical protein
MPPKKISNGHSEIALSLVEAADGGSRLKRAENRKGTSNRLVPFDVIGP